MKHLNRWNESKEWWIEEIEEMTQFLKDYCVDDNSYLKVLPNGESRWNIDMGIRKENGRGSSIEELTEQAVKMHEVNIEVYHLMTRLNSSGFKVSYYLIENTQHMNFDFLRVSIQGDKPNN